MKILYIAVHSHVGWGAEHWLNKAFNEYNIQTVLLDFRKEQKLNNDSELETLITNKSKDCDLIFLQRADNLIPKLFQHIKIPIVFWSTEPIKLKNDVDPLLESNIFSWVFVHSYSCINRIQNDFPHLVNCTSIMHNAAPKEKIYLASNKSIFSIFNRNLSWRRKFWLFPSKKIIKIIKGRFGDEYYNDLRDSLIAINIHYSSKNLDDFESGIFEAMASGCIVISESLDKQSLIDLGMEKAIIQVNSPSELKQQLLYLKDNPSIIKKYQKESEIAIAKNTWHTRAQTMKNKFKEFCNA